MHPDSHQPASRRRTAQDTALLGAIEAELEEGGAKRPDEASEAMDPFDLDKDDEGGDWSPEQ